MTESYKVDVTVPCCPTKEHHPNCIFYQGDAMNKTKEQIGEELARLVSNHPNLIVAASLEYGRQTWAEIHDLARQYLKLVKEEKND